MEEKNLELTMNFCFQLLNNFLKIALKKPQKK